MAFIRVINNHTGDEGLVDETWLVRWPEDFTPLGDEHAAHIADLIAAGAESASTETPPSDGTNEEDK